MLVLEFIALFIVLVPISLGIFTFNRQNREMRLLLLILIIMAFVEGYTKYLFSMNRYYYWVHHIYMPIEYSILAYIFSHWQHRRIFATIFKISIPVFIAFCIWNMLRIDIIHETIGITASVAFVLYVGMSSFALIHIQTENPNSILRDCRFWVSAALLIYSAGGIANFAFRDIILKEWLIAIPAIHKIFNIIMHLLYAMGFKCQSRS